MLVDFIFGKRFRRWFNSEKGSGILTESNPSKKLDMMLGETGFQHAIARSEANQSTYHRIEAGIINDYARIIDSKLLEVVTRLQDSDFLSSDLLNHKTQTQQFTQPKLRVHAYLECRAVLEYFIKHDVQQHFSPDSKQSAFRRWIDIAQCLLERGSYEGFLLVITNLHSMSVKHRELLIGLPTSYNEQFDFFCGISCPAVKTENYIQASTQERKFWPLFTIIQSLALFKDSMDEGSWNNSEESLNPDHPDHKLLMKRQQLLQRLADIKRLPSEVLPPNLQQTYEIFRRRYQHLPVDAKVRSVTTPRVLSDTAEPSKLYSRRLLPPTFFIRSNKEELTRQYYHQLFQS